LAGGHFLNPVACHPQPGARPAGSGTGISDRFQGNRQSPAQV